MDAFGKIRAIAAFLDKHGIPDACKEAEIILSEGLGIDRVELYRDNPCLSRSQQKKIDKILKRRAAREPLQYILGNVDFLGLRINVGRGVLIPRPETELLVLESLKAVRGRGDKESCILDLCTGSGCIALAIAKEFPYSQVYGTDVSGVAVRYARENAKINRITNAAFLKGSLFEPVRKSLCFDLIVSNPPYVGMSEIKGLQEEIRDWEPLEALNGGGDGLDFYRKILSRAGAYLKDSGEIILELGCNQVKDVKQIAVENGFINVEVKKDFGGIERILRAVALTPRTCTGKI